MKPAYIGSGEVASRKPGRIRLSSPGYRTLARRIGLRTDVLVTEFRIRAFADFDRNDAGDGLRAVSSPTHDHRNERSEFLPKRTRRSRRRKCIEAVRPVENSPLPSFPNDSRGRDGVVR